VPAKEEAFGYERSKIGGIFMSIMFNSSQSISAYPVALSSGKYNG
jgi:hypothetical protein